MNRKELLRRASKAGFGRIAAHTLYYAISMGHVAEAPRSGANGFAVYDKHHLDQLIKYLEARRPRIEELASTE